jgi:hypothetical protein
MTVGSNPVSLDAIVVGAVAIGLLSIAVFAFGRHPWSVTFGFTLWGGKIAAALGIDLSAWEFWQWPGPRRALSDSLLSDTSSLTDAAHAPCSRRSSS